MPARKSSYRRKTKTRSNNTKHTTLDPTPMTLTIQSVGQNGDGIANIDPDMFNGIMRAYIPNTLPGETITAIPKTMTKSAVIAEVTDIIERSDHRKDDDCEVADHCGGCQAHKMTTSFYLKWSNDLVLDALKELDIPASAWLPRFTTSYGGRRRARLAFRRLADSVVCGFRARRSHHIVPVSSCVILNPKLLSSIDALQNHILPNLNHNAQGEVTLTVTDYGIDMVLHPDEPLAYATLTKLIDTASKYEIDRLSIAETDGSFSPGFIKRQPQHKWETDTGAMTLFPAPGSFLQADADAETIMQKDIQHQLNDASSVLDLFCGSGTLSLPLLTKKKPLKLIQGYDSGAPALDAMIASARAAGFPHQVRVNQRNLIKDPLTPDMFDGFDAVIIDPPRSGALPQMKATTESDIKTVIMVSCNPVSFAQDVKILLDAGFTCSSIRIIDQFLRTSHHELVATFQRN